METTQFTPELTTELTTIAFTPGNNLSSFHPLSGVHTAHQIGAFDVAGGLEVLCAVLTLLYIGSLLVQGGLFQRQLDIASSVIKTSLQGQRVVRRFR